MQPTHTPLPLVTLYCRTQWLSSSWGGAWTHAGHSRCCCRCAQTRRHAVQQHVSCSSHDSSPSASPMQARHCSSTACASLSQLQLQSLHLCWQAATGLCVYRAVSQAEQHLSPVCSRARDTDLSHSCRCCRNRCCCCCRRNHCCCRTIPSSGRPSHSRVKWMNVW